VEVQLHCFLISTLDGQKLSPSLLVSLLPGKFLLGTHCLFPNQHPLFMKLGEPPSRFGRFRAENVSYFCLTLTPPVA